MIDVHVLGDRVLVALPPEDNQTVTASGIVLVRDPDARKLPTRGIVVQLGERSETVEIEAACQAIAGLQDPDDVLRALRALGPAPFDVQIGDCVLFPTSAGDEFTANGIDYVILREAEIIGIVEPVTSEAA